MKFLVASMMFGLATAAVQHGGLLAPHSEKAPHVGFLNVGSLHEAYGKQPQQPVNPWVRRAKWIGAGLLVSVGIGAGVFYVMKKKKTEEEEAAELEAEVERDEKKMLTVLQEKDKSVDYDKFFGLVAQQAAHRVGPALAKGAACKSILESRMQSFTDKTKAIVLNELNGTAAALFQELEAEEAMLLLDWNEAVSTNFPPMGTLCAGVLSPAVLACAFWVYVLQIVIVLLPVFCLCLWSVIEDWGQPCSIPTIFAWVISQVVLTGILLVSNTMLAIKIHNGKKDLNSKAEEMHERLQKAGVREDGSQSMEDLGVTGTRELFVCHSVILQQALLVEDDVRKSRWCYITGIGTFIWMLMTIWTFVLVMGWTFIPGVTAFHPNAIEVAKEDYCGAWATVFSARLCAVLTVLFFFPNMVTVGRWISDSLVSDPGYQKSVLEKAKSTDSGTFFGIPVMQTLVKAFVLRGTSEVASAQLALALHDKNQLQKDKVAAEADLAGIQSRLDVLLAREAAFQTQVETNEGEGFAGQIKALEKGLDSATDVDAWAEKGKLSVEEAKRKAAEVQEATTKELERMVEQIQEAVEAIRNSDTVKQAMHQAEELEHKAEDAARKLQEMHASGELQRKAEETVEHLKEQAEELRKQAEPALKEALAKGEELRKQAEPALEQALAKGEELRKQAEPALQQAQAQVSAAAASATEAAKKEAGKSSKSKKR